MTDGFGFDDRTADAAIGDTPTERVVAKLKKLNADPVRFDFGDEDVVRFVDRQWERVFGDGDEPRTTTFETFRPRVTRDDAVLDGPVGAGAPNHPLDGFRAKKLLNRAAGFPFRPGEEDFGEVGPRVVNAIKRFQAERGLAPDGVIQPEGPTVNALGQEAFESGGGRRTRLRANDFVPTKVPSPTLLTNARPMSGTSNAKATEVRSDGFNRDLLSFDRRYKKWQRSERLKEMQRQRAKQLNKFRMRSILQDRPAVFEVANDPSKKGNEPLHAVHSAGFVAVDLHARLIEIEARRAGVDPNLVKAIMYVENAQGHYGGLARFAEGFGLAKSILPMNIRPDLWAKLGFTERDFHDPRLNIRAGILLIKRIRDRLSDPSVAKIATLYNLLPAKKVTEFGARVANVYKKRPWLKP